VEDGRRKENPEEVEGQLHFDHKGTILVILQKPSIRSKNRCGGAQKLN
jgi:hypothetical protein